MTNILSFKYESVENLTNEEDGNYHIRIPTFYDFNSFSNNKVDFVFDTGAYITIISQRESSLFGFDDSFTVQHNVPLSGFAGGCLTDIKMIPGFVIGNRRLEGVKVAVPHIDTDINILGLNVIDLFKFYIDTEKDEIYFAQNPKPNIPESLRCGKVHIISSDIEGAKVSKAVTVSRWDTAEFLDSQEDIDTYLQVAFESGDTRQITKALGNVAKVMGMMDIAKKTGLTREHLYTSLGENGNPTLQTLTTIVNTLGYHLSIVPSREEI